MILSFLYRSENLHIVRYVHIGTMVLAAVLCAYSLIMLLPQANELVQAESKLHDLKCNLVDLNDKARDARRMEESMPSIGGGLDAFVSQVAAWSKARNVSIDTVSPDGNYSVVEIASGGKSLGKWNCSKITVIGHGQFEQVAAFLNEFLTTRIPVQLQSTALQTSETGTSGEVSFVFVFTLYEESKG